ncbi:amidase [Mycobacterium hodleri]|uniref:Amidase n=1 Tax=Mycolicibacterium hodleri TaxID=49897 RepID=A0A544W759_9MYCO|nr:amidase [Mycolicibacterium hodleri]TQR88058.1 amidase [Mycolicibacterium hodleri]
MTKASYDDVGSGPLHYRDATSLAAGIAGGHVSSRDVVQAHLDRIAELNPQINAIVTLRAEAALREADVADEAVRRDAEVGPLHGVPFTVKDSLDTAGIPTQRGTKLFAGFVPDSDATAVARFKSAGAILIAKTNLPEFSAWTETDNLVTGRTNNPWNLDRTPGGSSGGEAAALAAGMSPIGIGSDVAISLRGPAALTGVVALKATHGRIPYTGHFPTVTSAWWHVGPMARTVRDVALGYAILNGPDGKDGYAVHDEHTAAATTRVAGQTVRVGWVSDDAFAPVDPEVTAAVARAAGQLADLGCHVEQVRVPFIEAARPLETLMTLVNGELTPYIKRLATDREDQLSSIGVEILQMSDPTFGDVLAARSRAESLRSAFAGYFGRFDVLLCPVTPITAPPHAMATLEVDGVEVPSTHVMDATSVFNLTGLPALSVPFGFSSEGLPIGIQLVSRWFDESTILRLGGLLERRGGLGDRRPGGSQPDSAEWRVASTR